MNRSDFDPALFGKRKKKVKRCPNPLFVQWLGELKEDAASKNLKSQYTYAKAQNALKKYPIVLQSGKECKILEGFGDKICKLLDDKLREHIEIFGGVTVPDDDVTDQIPTKPKKKRKDPSATCTSTSNQGAPIDGIDDFGALTIPNPPNEGNNLDAPTQDVSLNANGDVEHIDISTCSSSPNTQQTKLSEDLVSKLESLEIEACDYGNIEQPSADTATVDDCAVKHVEALTRQQGNCGNDGGDLHEDFDNVKQVIPNKLSVDDRRDFDLSKSRLNSQIETQNDDISKIDELIISQTSDPKEAKRNTDSELRNDTLCRGEKEAQINIESTAPTQTENTKKFKFKPITKISRGNLSVINTNNSSQNQQKITSFIKPSSAVPQTTENNNSGKILTPRPINDAKIVQSTISGCEFTLPPIISEPAMVPVVVNSESMQLVVFDLETSGLDESCEIIQIAARYPPNNLFNRYILPTDRISRDAARVTKLYHKKGKLFHNRQKVQTYTFEISMQDFVAWLPLGSVLIAHNVMFDMRFLLSAICSTNQETRFCDKVKGFGDTLPYFRKLYPNRRKYNQESLIQDLIGKDYNAHNAVGDVQALSQLISDVQIQDILPYTFTTSCAFELKSYTKSKQETVKTLKPLTNEKIISQGIAEKIAGSGLNLSDIEQVYDTLGENGLKQMFTQENNGKARVTKNSKIIASVCSFMAKK